jgi:purine-binding chemotaxis protein CheW
MLAQSSAELLTFEVDHQRFGIALADVREVVRAVSMARLPKVPKIVEGVINLRGQAIASLDLRARFGLSPKAVEPSDQLVIAWAKKTRLVAIRVDRVIDLLTVDTHEIATIESIVPVSEYISGVAKLPDGIVLIHDLATFLSEAEARALDAIAELVA